MVDSPTLKGESSKLKKAVQRHSAIPVCAEVLSVGVASSHDTIAVRRGGLPHKKANFALQAAFKFNSIHRA
jgi:hypothetical protein